MEKNEKHTENGKDATRRDLLKVLGKSAYIAPVTLALLASKSHAVSLI